MLPEDKNQSLSTKVQYFRRAVSLIRKAKKELSIPYTDHIDPRQLVAWLASRKKDLARPSWRQYKSSLIAYLEAEENESPDIMEALDWLREIDVQGCKKSSEKTSGTKLKKLNNSDFYKITEHLRNSTGKWHSPLLDWMVSGTLTGLRPQEWATAKISKLDGATVLVVNNAKNTNGRAHGPIRTLVLSALSTEEVETIRRHLERCNQFSDIEQFHEIYDGCSHTLHYVCRKLWPRRSKHVTLYSCRHQFSANAKASGFSREEIAAMMGHAVNDTATRHYGRRTAGDELVRVHAIQDEVDKIIQKKRGWDDSFTQASPSIKKKLHNMPEEGFVSKEK